MSKPKCLALSLLGALFLATELSAAPSISVEGAPADIGFNVGSLATIRATVKGVTDDASRYAVFADIQYAGGATVTSVEMERQAGSVPQELRYEAAWPIPSDAPTGLYTVLVRVEDRSSRKVVATQKLRSFVAYKKIARIARAKLDKTFYIVGEPIQCEVVLENLTGGDLKDLRVEFSNANYPWISLFSGEANLSGKQSENPQLALKVLRDHLNLAARGMETIPMMPAGTAAFLQGTQVAVLGAGGPARHEKVPPPEVGQYTIALWNADRTVLYDMQFSERAIVRPPDRDLPKPYSNNFTHPYDSDIDFIKYREFYPPGQISSAIRLSPSHTLYPLRRRVQVAGVVRNTSEEAWTHVGLRAEIFKLSGEQIPTGALMRPQEFDLAPGKEELVGAEVPTTLPYLGPGLYNLKVSVVDSHGQPKAAQQSEFAVNSLPSSLLVFCPHEDDEHSYAGLIRAAVEADIPVRVVVFTGGDVGACERYYSKPCGPNEAREFGMVRMEETAEALEHIGLARDKLTFLGLPDGGSGAIWSEHIKTSNPFLSIYLATDHAPYDNILKPNLPYARDAVIELVKQIIVDFRPAMIASPHPDERHVDHRTTNWFVIKACQELLSEKRIDPKTIILADQAYGAGGFKPAPYHYEKAPVYLSGQAAALKQEMGWIYQSQDGNLNEGMRHTFAELSRQEIHYRILDWQEHAGWNE